MAIPNLSNALIDLFDRQKHDLPPEQLRWLGGLSFEAEIQAAQLSESLQVLATLSNDQGAISMPSDDSLSMILYGLAEKSANIVAMIAIIREASYLADQAKPQDQKKAN